MKFKYYTIYKITNNITNEIYIGSHKTNHLQDKYYGSGTMIKQKLKEYGRENFIKETLHIFDNVVDMSNKERELVNEEFIKRNDNYNMRIGAASCYDKRLLDVKELDDKILSMITTKSINTICEELIIERHRVTNCLIKNGLNISDVFQDPKLTDEQLKFILDNYREMRKYHIAKYLEITPFQVESVIKEIDINFKFKSIYKKDFLDLYIRKGLSLGEIAEAYNFCQSNLTRYMTEYRVDEVKRRLKSYESYKEISRIMKEYNTIPRGIKRKQFLKDNNINMKFIHKYLIQS